MTDPNAAAPPPTILPIDTGHAATLVFMSGVGIILAAIIGVLYVGSLFDQIRTANAARVEAERLTRDFVRCNAPPKPGDQAVIVIRNGGDRFITTCQLVTNWQEPERAIK